MNTPTKTGWYRARWDATSPISYVMVGMLGPHLRVSDTEWSYPLNRVAEWGPCVDDLEVEVVSLRAELDALRAPQSECAAPVGDEDLPEHYRVTFCGGHDYPEHDYWQAGALVDGVGIDASAKAAKDACRRHFDAVTAPLRDTVERLTAEVGSLREVCIRSVTLTAERTVERDAARRACATMTAMIFESVLPGRDEVRRHAIELYGADEAARLFPDGGSR